MIDLKTLKQVGLEENEAKIYLALLELGETTVIPLSKEASLARTTCYSVIDRMANKGLLSKVTRGKHVYLSAASPEKLHEIAILNEEEAREQRKTIAKVIPQLVGLSEKAPGKPKIQYFSGRQGVRAIFEDLLTSGEVKSYYLGSVQKCVGIVGESFIKDWIKRRVKAGIFSYGVRIETEEEFTTTFKSSRKKMRQIKFAPQGADFPVYTVIYGNKVAFITSKKEGFGLILESKDFTTTFKSLFDITWQASRNYRERK